MSAETAHAFAERYGYRPHGVWSAPGRANLIGEHTDYNGGFALPLAIQLRTRVAAAPRPDGLLRLSSDSVAGQPVEVSLAELDRALGLGDPRNTEAFATRPEARPSALPQPALPQPALPQWVAYPLGVIWALRSHAAKPLEVSGLDLHFTSEVPLGAGLSSSAAIECATAVAVDELWKLNLDPLALAAAGQRAENEAVGAPTGIMDQTAAMLGRADCAILLDCRSLETLPVPLPLRDHGLELLVIDTGVRHAHATGGYGERRRSCEAAASALGVETLREITRAELEHQAHLLDPIDLRRARHVVAENQRVLDTVAALHEQGPARIGELLTASHVSLRDDFEVSVPELDLAVECALEAGAIGARMTGGGFGGSAIALVPSSATPSVREALSAGFAAAGFAQPRAFIVTPSDGARREA